MFRFRFASFMLPVVIGLALFVGRPAPSSAQVVCRNCVEVLSSSGRWAHTFMSATLQCNSAINYGGRVGPGWIQCSRCGGSSECHTEIDLSEGGISWGRCHQRCNQYYSDADLAETVSDLGRGFETGDMTWVTAIILRRREGLSVEYIPEAGRIDFVLSCDPSRAARTIAVPPEVRRALDTELAAGFAAATS